MTIRYPLTVISTQNSWLQSCYGYLEQLAHDGSSYLSYLPRDIINPCLTNYLTVRHRMFDLSQSNNSLIRELVIRPHPFYHFITGDIFCLTSYSGYIVTEDNRHLIELSELGKVNWRKRYIASDDEIGFMTVSPSYNNEINRFNRTFIFSQNKLILWTITIPPPWIIHGTAINRAKTLFALVSQDQKYQLQIHDLGILTGTYRLSYTNKYMWHMVGISQRTQGPLIITQNENGSAQLLWLTRDGTVEKFLALAEYPDNLITESNIYYYDRLAVFEQGDKLCVAYCSLPDRRPSGSVLLHIAWWNGPCDYTHLISPAGNFRLFFDSAGALYFQHSVLDNNRLRNLLAVWYQ